MTVAAVILADSADSALAEVEGLARVRRLADAAWAGGALPIVVVAPERDGLVAGVLVGAPVVLAEPAPVAQGPAAQMARGVDVATTEIRETDAAIVWPVRMVWAGPETITSLIEAHGLARHALIRPAYRGELGWPVLLPLSAVGALRVLPPAHGLEAVLDDLRTAGIPERALELGDPGTVLDATIDRAHLPPYEGPQDPVGGLVREWGAPAAEEPDDAPLSGPSLAPYPQAADDQEG